MVPSAATEKVLSVTPPGIDPETVRLVAQCPNHYATPDPQLRTPEVEISGQIHAEERVDFLLYPTSKS
jgi:hypothetical protein